MTNDQIANALAPVLMLAVAGLMGWFFRQARRAISERISEFEARQVKHTDDAVNAVMKKQEETTEIAARALEESQGANKRLDLLNGSVGHDRGEIMKLNASMARLEGTIYGNKALDLSREEP